MTLDLHNSKENSVCRFCKMRCVSQVFHCAICRLSSIHYRGSQFVGALVKVCTEASVLSLGSRGHLSPVSCIPVNFPDHLKTLQKLLRLFRSQVWIVKSLHETLVVALFDVARFEGFPIAEIRLGLLTKLSYQILQIVFPRFHDIWVLVDLW